MEDWRVRLKRSRPNAKPEVQRGSATQIGGEVLVEILTDVLGKGFLFSFSANGSSMLPFIQDGDLITIAPKRQSSLQIGRVAAYASTDQKGLVAHRIISKKRNVYLIKADNSSVIADGWIPKERILGYVVRVERAGRPVHFGLGAERLLIAFLSRKSILTRSVRWINAHFHNKK